MNKLLASVLDDLFCLHADTSRIWSSDLGNPRQESCLCCSVLLPAAPRRCPRLPRAFCLVQSHTRCRQSAGLTRVPSNVWTEFQKYLLAFWWDPDRFGTSHLLTDGHSGTKGCFRMRIVIWFSAVFLSGLLKNHWIGRSAVHMVVEAERLWWLFLARLLSCVRLFCSLQHAPHKATYEGTMNGRRHVHVIPPLRHKCTQNHTIPVYIHFK